MAIVISQCGDEEPLPPRTFLRCGNVRQWALAVSSVNSVYHVIAVWLYVFFLDKSLKYVMYNESLDFWLNRLKYVCGASVNFTMIIYSRKLRLAVLQRDFDALKLWFKLYVVWLVCWTYTMSCTIIAYAATAERHYDNIERNVFEEFEHICKGLTMLMDPSILQWTVVVSKGVMTLWFSVSMYQVYRYYEYEKTARSAALKKARLQTIINDIISHI